MLVEKVERAREDADGAEGARDRERDGRDHLRHLGLGPDAVLDDGPDADLVVAAAGEEEAVVLWVEGERRDVVGMLEDREAIGSCRMPQSRRLNRYMIARGQRENPRMPPKKARTLSIAPEARNPYFPQQSDNIPSSRPLQLWPGSGSTPDP